jgi:DNA invertase Pin-like site-specific DNA recombinase
MFHPVNGNYEKVESERVRRRRFWRWDVAVAAGKKHGGRGGRKPAREDHLDIVFVRDDFPARDAAALRRLGNRKKTAFSRASTPVGRWCAAASAPSRG